MAAVAATFAPRRPLLTKSPAGGARQGAGQGEATTTPTLVVKRGRGRPPGSGKKGTPTSGAPTPTPPSSKRKARDDARTEETTEETEEKGTPKQRRTAAVVAAAALATSEADIDERDEIDTEPAAAAPAAAAAAAAGAATSAPTIEGLLTNYLLGSTLYDNLPLDRFQSFFPAKFTQHPDVRSLYRQYQAAREEIRGLIRRNVGVEVAAFSSDAQAPSALSLDSALRTLGTRKAEMLAEIQRLNTDIEVLAGRLHAYSDELKSVGLGMPPPTAAFNLEGAKALAANLKSLVSD